MSVFNSTRQGLGKQTDRRTEGQACLSVPHPSVYLPTLPYPNQPTYLHAQKKKQTEFIGYLLPYFLTAILPTMIGLGWRKVNPDLVRTSCVCRPPRKGGTKVRAIRQTHGAAGKGVCYVYVGG